MKKLVVLLVVLVGFGGTAMSQSIAHVKSQLLWDTIPSAKIALENYAKEEKDAYDQITEMQGEFENAVQVYEATKMDMTTLKRQYEEKELMEMQGRIESTNQSLKDYLIQTSNELNAPLQSRIKRAIDIVAERMKLAYVFDESAAIYSAGGKDITDAVIVVLLKLDKEESAAEVIPN